MYYCNYFYSTFFHMQLKYSSVCKCLLLVYATVRLVKLCTVKRALLCLYFLLYKQLLVSSLEFKRVYIEGCDSGLRYGNFFLIFRLYVISVFNVNFWQCCLSYKRSFLLLFSTKSGVDLPPSLDFSNTAQGFFEGKVRANNWGLGPGIWWQKINNWESFLAD